MRVDFYQLAGDGAEGVVPLLARNTLRAGERMVVVSGDSDQLAGIGDALWRKLPDTFLAHGHAGEAHASRQPVLLSATVTEPENGARFVAITDGRWRDTDAAFARTFFLFDDATLQEARACWRELGKREGLERHFWKQQGGRWSEAG